MQFIYTFLKHPMTYAALISSALLVTSNSCSEAFSKNTKLSYPSPTLSRLSSTLYGGLMDDSLKVVQTKLKPKQKFQDLLKKTALHPDLIERIICESEGVFDTKQMVAGQPFTLIKDKNSEDVHYVIYEKEKTEYVVMDVRKPAEVKVFNQQKNTEIKQREVIVKISGSIFHSIEAAHLNPELGNKVAELMSWSFDFFRVKKGDYCKVIYDEKLVDGEPIEIVNVYAVCFVHEGKEHYAFQYMQNGKLCYFDEKGNSLRKAFLKAPLKYSRISSGFTNSRFHPILHIYRAHNGIDYAAPTGTPIMTIGDGVVEEIGRARGNGNYVKIKHNKIYGSQYLHMSRFAKGLKKGDKVAQGDVIGYVGSTGLATGPHLCFRFWKNGVQVNPATNISDAQSDPIAKSVRPQFDQYVAQMMKAFNNSRLMTTSGITKL